MYVFAVSLFSSKLCVWCVPTCTVVVKTTQSSRWVMYSLCIAVPSMPVIVCGSVSQQGLVYTGGGRADGVRGRGQDQQVWGYVVAMSCVQGRDVCGQ